MPIQHLNALNLGSVCAQCWNDVVKQSQKKGVSLCTSPSTDYTALQIGQIGQLASEEGKFVPIHVE